MDSFATLADKAAIYIAAYKYYINVKKSIGIYDLSIFGEGLSKKLSSIVFPRYELKNLNNECKNFPAIDLGDKNNRFSIQVSISCSSDKVINTLDMFHKHKLYQDYDKLVMFILGEKQKEYTSKNIKRDYNGFKFSPENDIYDLNDLYRCVIDSKDSSKMQSFIDCFETELGDKIRPLLTGFDKPGQNIRKIFEGHEITATTAITILEKYGINRDVYTNTTRLNEQCTTGLINYIANQFSVSTAWIDGESSHIYSGGPDIEKNEFWHKSLTGAVEFIKRISKKYNEITILMPSKLSLETLFGSVDIFDRNSSCYQTFQIIGTNSNDFQSKKYSLIVNETLSCSSLRLGLYRVMLAVELINLQSQSMRYIDIIVLDDNDARMLNAGVILIAEALLKGVIYGNHTDYFYKTNNSILQTNKVNDDIWDILNKELNDLSTTRSL